MTLVVDLNTVRFQIVLPIIQWCLAHNIDQDKCVYLLEAWYSNPPKDVKDWTLTIPDKYATMFLLKWPNEF